MKNYFNITKILIFLVLGGFIIFLPFKYSVYSAQIVFAQDEDIDPRSGDENNEEEKEYKEIPRGFDEYWELNESQASGNVWIINNVIPSPFASIDDIQGVDVYDHNGQPVSGTGDGIMGGKYSITIPIGLTPQSGWGAAIKGMAVVGSAGGGAVGTACNINDTGYTRVRNTLLNAENFTISDLACFAGGIVEVLLTVAWVAAVIWILISGIQYGLALGDVDKTAGAKKSLIWAVVGLIISLSAYGIMIFIRQTFLI
ncbi:MAG: hypothetical protein ABH837_02700 [bacterium]